MNLAIGIQVTIVFVTKSQKYFFSELSPAVRMGICMNMPQPID